MKIGAFSFDKRFGDFRVPWYKYYSQECDEVEIINDSVPAGKDVYEKFNFVSPVLEAKMKDMFERNDVVIYADIDEYLIPDPFKYRGLRDYVEGFVKSPEPYVRATGMNVIQTLEEKKINMDRELLEQRRFWARATFYDKFNICKKPEHFEDGMVNPGLLTKPIPSENLMLVHLKYIDLGIERKRGKQRRGYKKERDMLDQFVYATSGATVIPQKYKII